MSRTDYLPGREADLVDWMENAVEVLTPRAEEYGLVPDDITALTGFVQMFVASYNTFKEPMTRTPVARAGKDTAKAELIDFVRPMIRRIQGTTTVTPAMKAALRIPVYDREPSEQPVPATRPLVSDMGVSDTTVHSGPVHVTEQ